MNARIYTLTGARRVATPARQEPLELHPSAGILTALALSVLIWGALLALFFAA